MSDSKIPSEAVDFLYNVASRRSFLRTAAVTAIAGGGALQLSGAAEILWDDPAQAAFPGAERLVRFRVAAARFWRGGLAGRLLSRSPFNPQPGGGR